MLKSIGFLVSIVFLFTACTDREKENNYLHVNVNTEPPTLDPRKAGDSTSVNVILMLFEGLTRMTEKDATELALADQVKVSQDGLVYEFHLRDANWSNGDPITARDFLYSYQTTLDPLFPSPLGYKLFIIKNAKEIKEKKLPKDKLGIEVIDDHTIRFILEHPAPYFLELLTFPLFFPVREGIDEVNDKWPHEEGFISNGPFTLSKWKHENEMVVIKNQNYWDRDTVKLDGIILPIISDTMTEFYLFEQKKLDVAGSPLSNLPSEILPILKKEGRLKRVPFSAVYYYAINTESFPLNNADIRRALSLAINREEIITHILQSEQSVATSFVPPLPMRDSLHQITDNDPKLAKALFTKGLSDLSLTLEKFPPLTLIFNVNREHQKIAETIQRKWEETFGIKVKLEHFDWKVYLSKVKNKEFHVARMGWVGDMNDPITFLEPFIDQKENNHTGWKNDEYSNLLYISERELNPTIRNELLAKAEKILVSEMPLIPLYFIMGFYLKQPYVKNIIFTQLGTVDFKKTFIQQH